MQHIKVYITRFSVFTVMLSYYVRALELQSKGVILCFITRNSGLHFHKILKKIIYEKEWSNKISERNDNFTRTYWVSLDLSNRVCCLNFIYLSLVFSIRVEARSPENPVNILKLESLSLTFFKILKVVFIYPNQNKSQ